MDCDGTTLTATLTLDNGTTLTAQGDDGPGAYGTGFTLTARPAAVGARA